jgi:hypothetical protein
VPPPVADVGALLRALIEDGVEFVVVGGVCAVMNGAPISTLDLDIVPDRSPDNVPRLMRSLDRLEAEYRDIAGRSLAPDAELIRGAGHNLFLTRSGPLDVLGEIGRGRDFAALHARSHVVDIGDGLEIRVLDLDALIEIKREVLRDKDRATLPILERTLEERRRTD